MQDSDWYWSCNGIARMIPGKLTVVVGLPGAGKSALVTEKRCAVTGLCIEDFHADAIGDSPLIENSRHYRALIEAIRAGHDCVIADIAFCDPQRRDSLHGAVARQIPGVQWEWIYFENAPEKCKRNILRRNRQSLSSDLEALDRLVRLYRIPDGVAPRPIREIRDP